MTAREAILAAVRTNQPRGAYILPDVPDFALGEQGDPAEIFRRNLEIMGGRSDCCDDASKAVAALFPSAGIIASAVPEVAGNFDLDRSLEPKTLADVDVAIVRATFGVAETGSVLLVDDAMKVNAIAYLAQHLVVLLSPERILPTMHRAYREPELLRRRYSSFHTGPSATADIEGVLVLGAQGVRSLHVLIDA